ncbi:MAG: sigma-70 family RNA polymerase sigma factor [Acidobacteriota bacterium]|nr:sigma-70 family RNA polymerase sigma factor [Acidobacteriota bacterium]
MSSPILLDLNSSVQTSNEDADLIAGLRAGLETAYERLIQRFQQPVFNLAYRLLNDSGDASDVAQEVFLKVFRNVGGFRQQSSLRTWIYRIAVNEAHNRRRWLFRHRHKEVGLDAEFEDEAPRERMLRDPGRSPFDRTFDGERQILIGQALAAINPSFREAIVLRDLEDLSYDEIAEVLQISLGTVKSRILRGREALRGQLAERLNPAPALHPVQTREWV